MTEDEFVEAVRRGVRAELSAVGLRVDDPEDQDEAKEDFRFVRRLRRGVDGVAGKIGGAVILAAVSGALWLIWTGFQNIVGKAH